MRRAFFLTLVLCPPLFAQSSSATTPSANELVRKAVNQELQADSRDHSHWMYQVEKRIPAPAKIQTVVETANGSLSCLEKIDGRPLTADQRQSEQQRIHAFVNDPDQQSKARRASANDDKQSTRLFTMLPDAFLFTVAQSANDAVKLTFRPNPDFRSHSAEEYVFHKMDGFVLIDPRSDRLIEISGRLTHGVEFAGGLLGHLDPGGTFDVRLDEVAPGITKIARLKVDMHGRALFFKTIGDQEDETHSQFKRLPDDITLAQAEQLLERQQSMVRPAE